MSKLKIGIIGCGGIANDKHMPSMAKQPDVELVAFCDLILERAEKAASQYGVAGAKVYTDYRQLLEDKSIDAVHVLTPNVSHCEISCAAMEAGKHVMCEKPMAANVEDAQKMMDTAKRTGKLLTIGYQYRLMDTHFTMKRYCDAGYLGEIYYAEANAIRRRGVPTWGVFTDKSKQGGGPLIDIATHALDLTLWMMDNYEPKSVTGVTFEKLGKYLGPDEQGNTMGVWDPEKYEVEDSAFGFVVMKNGALINVKSSWALNIVDNGGMVRLCGTKGGLDSSMEGVRLNQVILGKQTITNIETVSPFGRVHPRNQVMNPNDAEATHWVNALKGRGELFVKPEQAFVVTKILDAIYKSAASGKTIYFD
ncbi:MAG: Gfo/Idh/MocA family oxidoreductase [Clostridiales bacterium]|nr:Gfo/Idh/MocA family oxidoreductase [Clostridiales bacterium]